MRPASITSNGGANTFAPSSCARFAASSALATVTYAFQCGGAPLLALLGPHRVRGADFLAAHLKHRIRLARSDRLLVDVPAEERAVERDAGLLIGGGQLGPGEVPMWMRREFGHGSLLLLKP